MDLSKSCFVLHIRNNFLIAHLFPYSIIYACARFCTKFLADLWMNKHTLFLHGFSKSNILYLAVLHNYQSPLVGKNNCLLGRDVVHCTKLLDAETA